MNTPHPIPYQGSKRHLAPQILKFFPSDVDMLFEPFAGSAAVSIAAAERGLAQRFTLNDLNEPLIHLWRVIINEPRHIIQQYTELWTAQCGREKGFYNDIRSEFNRTKRPDYFLYLLARCVKAAVRYNSDGEFNQSSDNRRKGVQPAQMRQPILGASSLLRGRTDCCADDYRSRLENIGSRDLVYLDPPYQGVSGARDPRYLERISFNEFVNVLERLTTETISYLVSFDGRTGEKIYGQPLPAHLNLRRVEVDAGRSSQATLLGGNARTYESLYISPALANRLEQTVSVYNLTAPCAAWVEAAL